MDSTVVEFNVDTVLYDRVVLSADVGFGGIDEGRLLDQEFLLDDRQGTFSTSFSPASGDDLAYFTLDLGFRVLSRRDARGEIERYLDLFVGWQSWRESYIAHGGSGVNILGPFPLPDVPVIKHDLDWNSFRLGARGHFEIFENVALRSRIALVPYTECQFEDTHYLRSEMQQPGWIANVDGGWGVMFDQTVAWNVWRGLFIEVGYQTFHLNSGSCDFEVHSVGNPTAVGQFNEATMTRQGLLLAVRYQL